jgi:hypothetical protein
MKTYAERRDGIERDDIIAFNTRTRPYVRRHNVTEYNHHQEIAEEGHKLKHTGTHAPSDTKIYLDVFAQLHSRRRRVASCLGLGGHYPSATVILVVKIQPLKASWM